MGKSVKVFSAVKVYYRRPVDIARPTRS